MSQSKARESLRERISYLNQFNHNDIAEYFFSYGIVSTLHAVIECPVSNWLRSEIDWAHIVILSSKQVSAYPRGGLEGSNKLDSAISMTPYENVRIFMANFDAGNYPQLIDS